MGPLLGRWCVQNFNGGSNQKLAIMSSASGTFQVNDVRGLWTFYFANDGMTTHGYPVNDEYSFADGSRQDFERDFII